VQNNNFRSSVIILDEHEVKPAKNSIRLGFPREAPHSCVLAIVETFGPQVGRLLVLSKLYISCFVAFAVESPRFFVAVEHRFPSVAMIVGVKVGGLDGSLDFFPLD
jgi:hypothetical protein